MPRKGFVGADVERAQDQGSSVQPPGDVLVGRVLLVFARQRVTLEKQELGAQEPNALGAVRDGRVDVGG